MVTTPYKSPLKGVSSAMLYAAVNGPPKQAPAPTEKNERQYAAAKSGYSTGDWTPSSKNVNTEIGTSTQSINARVRQLVRDMPHASIAVDRVVDLTIGDGLKLRSRIRLPGSNKLNKKLNQQVEDAWKYWGDEADFSGALHINELMALSKRQDTEIGESLTIKRAIKGKGRYLPLALQLIEADQLTTWNATPKGNNELALGVEYDPRTLERMAYHIDKADPKGASLRLESTRILARDVIHKFKTLRPGQLRGVSPFAPAVVLTHNIRDYLEAEIDGAKAAARDLAYVHTDDPDAYMRAMGVENDTNYTPTRKVEEIGTAVTTYLLPHEQITLANSNRPGNGFDPFTQFVLRTFAAVLGLSYELISNDYRGLNYSVLRGIRNDLTKQLDVQTARHIRHFCEPVRREFMDWCVLTGRLDLPGYWSNPWPYLRGTWQGPGMLPVDPLKEGRANTEAIKHKRKSPQQVIDSEGRDPEEVLDECAEWQEELRDRELEDEPTSTEAQTNPAAMG